MSNFFQPTLLVKNDILYKDFLNTVQSTLERNGSANENQVSIDQLEKIVEEPDGMGETPKL